MKFSILTPDILFSFFYIFSFVMTSVIILIIGLKRNYDLKSMLLTLITISLFSIIGSRLLTIPILEWANIFNSDLSIDYNGRSALGALIFGFLGLMLSQSMFKFKKPIIDLYAWVTPLGLGLQKTGCFFMGCCYGTSSDRFWSVSYPKGTQAHFNHWSSGFIESDGLTSLSVHPVQLYEMILLFLISYIVFKSINFWKKNGSVILFSLFLFTIFRFLIEFVRDPASSQFNESYIMGIRSLQWIILLVGLAIVSILLFYEKTKVREMFLYHGENREIGKYIKYVLTISIAMYFFHELFSKFEFIVLFVKLIPAIFVVGYSVYENNLSGKYRFISTCLLLTPLILISQSIQDEPTNVKKYKRIDVGASVGSFQNEIAYNPREGECGTTYTHELYEYRYRMGGIGYSQISIEGDKITTYGVNVHGGNSKEINLTKNTENSKFIYGVNPYVSLENRWTGVGVGAQFGNLRWVPSGNLDKKTMDNGTKSSPVTPEFYLRLGRPHILDIKYTYGFNFPSPFPSQTATFSLGTGFGLRENYRFRYGIMQSPNAKFFSAEGLLNKNLGLSATYIYDTEGYYDKDAGSESRLVFGLNYRFNFK
jgi:phosphatidylglycerol:prolipoprotein diacylglycerol transferase